MKEEVGVHAGQTTTAREQAAACSSMGTTRAVHAASGPTHLRGDLLGDHFVKDGGCIAVGGTAGKEGRECLLPGEWRQRAPARHARTPCRGGRSTPHRL